jgi:hypothetical protein
MNGDWEQLRNEIRDLSRDEHELLMEAVKTDLFFRDSKLKEARLVMAGMWFADDSWGDTTPILVVRKRKSGVCFVFTVEAVPSERTYSAHYKLQTGRNTHCL